jgi:hypothetical protein
MADKIVPEIDPNTPADVKITLEAREPEFRPDIGIALKGKPPAGKPKHRLVTIGDSLTHGFQSGAIYNTGISYPAIIAYELGWLDRFRRPTYGGPGGLPLNIEYLVRMLEHEFGDKLDWWELAFAGFKVRGFMDDLEDYWERGAGKEPPNMVGINHNLAVYGWDLRDTMYKTATRCWAKIGQPKDQFLSQKVEADNDRAALRVLPTDPAMKDMTVLQCAAQLASEGTVKDDGTPDDPKGDGIETLLVLLGANNCLASIVHLHVAWTQDADYNDPDQKGKYSVWQPKHFAAELDLLAKEVAKIRARHVIWGTVPHVTIAPVARGVGTKIRRGSRYFPYYTRPWIKDEDFSTKDDPYITSMQARAIDSAIDQYNESIVAMVAAARKAGKDWLLLDVAGVLDRLAARRYIADPQARPAWWTPYDLPAELKNLVPVPDSRFFGSDPTGRIQGGMFSLDGVHPTTIAYGILAQEFINVMQAAGVIFNQRDGVTPRIGPAKVDFQRLVSLDSLISQPPSSLSSDLRLIGWLDHAADLFKGLFRKS